MKHGKTPGSFQDTGAKALRANFRKIEHREWWLWVTAAIITLLLTFALVSFLLPNPAMPQDFHTLYVLPQAVRGLVALVFLFDLYTIYQHLQIHRIRRQLIEREELFHLISQNAADMIAVVDLEGRRIFNSLSYQKILGNSPEELQESFANRDITERKKVQEALVRSEASFRSLVEGRWHYLHACRKHATAISTHKPAKRQICSQILATVKSRMAAPSATVATPTSASQFFRVSRIAALAWDP